MKELAIIIPMYNEEANAERAVVTVSRVLDRELPGTKLFAVNDGSKDSTLSILESLKPHGLPFEIISHSPNRGYGGALQAGMKAALAAGFEFGLVMDSDLTNDPELIPQFAKVLSSKEYDVVKASRYIKGGGMRGVPLWRQMYTIVGNRLAASLFGMGVRDCTNGFHAVRLSLVANEQFVERGFPFLLEELYVLKKKGAKASEIPYILTARADDEGISKFSYRPKVLMAYLKYALKAAFV